MDIQLVQPKVYIDKGTQRYDLHWDYQSTEAEDILDENYHFLVGYFEGCFDALADGKAKIVCLSANTGTFRNLSLDNAEKLKKLFKAVMEPLVEARYKKMVRDENLPHIKFSQD